MDIKDKELSEIAKLIAENGGKLLTEDEMKGLIGKLLERAKGTMSHMSDRDKERAQELMELARDLQIAVFEELVKIFPEIAPQNIISAMTLKVLAGCLAYNLTPAHLQVMMHSAITAHDRNASTVQ